MGFKTNTQKPAFQSCNHDLAERELKKETLFTIASKIKYIGISFINEWKDLCNESWNTRKKKIKDTQIGKIFLVCELEELLIRLKHSDRLK